MNKTDIFTIINNDLLSGKRINRLDYMNEFDLLSKTFKRYINQFWCNLSNDNMRCFKLIKFNVNEYQLLYNNCFFKTQYVGLIPLDDDVVDSLEYFIKDSQK